jgi:hypothetical protein
MSRRNLFLLAGIVIGLLAWWSVSNSFSSAGAPPNRTAQKNAPHVRAPPPLPPPQEVKDRAHARGPTSRNASRESETAPAAAARKAGATLHGTIVAIDESGQEQKELDGAFKLHWMEGKEARTVDVAVKGGRFTSEVPPSGNLAVDDVVLGDRIGRLADSVMEIPASGEVALHVRLIPASTLKVVDASTRAELDGIEVVYDVDAFAGAERLAPRGDGDTRPVVSGKRSPVVMPPLEGTPRCWVHVKGYAWNLVEVQQLVGGEREVALTPGGTLAITFLQMPERDDLVVVVRNESTEKSFKAPITAATRELADVDPGRCTVEVGIAAQARDWSALASLPCDVHAGETTRAEIVLRDIPSAPRVARVPFRGLVVGADARLTMKLVARLSSLDPAQQVAGPDRFTTKPLLRDPARPDAWSFDFGTILPGKKLVTVEPLQVHQVFEVGPEGQIDARIDLPALGEIEVAVTDAVTGAALANAGVSWRSASHPMADDDVPQSAETAGDPPVARFLAPLGPIKVSCWPDSYSHAERDVEVLTSLQKVDLSVQHEQYVRVVFRQRSANVPIDPDTMEFALLDSAGKNHQVGWAKEYETGALKLIVDDPGDYTLRFPKVTGFREMADRVVRVEAGGTAEVEVELTGE